MSDYCPPETLMHINELPEECLRFVFTPMPLVEQLNAGQVCKLWRKVQTGLCHTKQSLIVVLYKYDFIPWEFTQFLKERDLSEDSALTISVELDTKRIASLKTIFSNVSEITVLSKGVPTLEAQLAMLLTQFQNQLVTFNLKAVEMDRGSAVARFIDAINGLAHLKHLSLCFDTTAKFDPFDMPLLTQLKSLEFKCPSMPISILELWAPRLESRSEPLQIVSFVCGTYTKQQVIFTPDNHPCDVKPFLSLSAKVAAMFTKLPKINCTLLQLQQLSALFTNVTHLKLVDDKKASYSASVPALLQALFAFKKLTNLSIHTGRPRKLNRVAINAQLPQLSSVKDWSLHIDYKTVHVWGYGAYSHVNLNRWTENIGWVFPNLERLLVCLDSYHACRDCPFDAHMRYDEDTFEADLAVKAAEAKACLVKQLRPIKQQMPKLNYGYIYWESMHVEVDDAEESLSSADSAGSSSLERFSSLRQLRGQCTAIVQQCAGQPRLSCALALATTTTRLPDALVSRQSASKSFILPPYLYTSFPITSPSCHVCSFCSCVSTVTKLKA